MRRALLILATLSLLPACLELPSELPDPTDVAADTEPQSDTPEEFDVADGGGRKDVGGAPDGSSDAGTEHVLFKEVSAGRAHACAIADDDTLWCWGDNSFDQANPDSTANPVVAPEQVTVDGHVTFATIARGGDRDHTCVVTTDHTAVYCWGENNALQKDPGDDASDNTASQVIANLGGPARLAASATHTCLALRDGSGVRCWGASGGAAVGTEMAPGPNAISLEAREVGVSADVSLALADDQLWIWGDIDSPVVPTDLDGVVDCTSGSCLFTWTGSAPFENLAVGPNHACAIDKSSHYLWCWGANDAGRASAGTPNPPTVEAPAATEQTVQKGKATIGVGARHTCVIRWMDDGSDYAREIRCLGDDSSGQAPVRVAGDFFAVTAGEEFACALEFSEVVGGDDIGELLCWGNNDAGQLGIGDTESHEDPVRIPVPRP